MKRSFVPLFATNFFGVVNDNFLKGRATSPSFGPTLIKSVLLWLFVAPFVTRRRVTMHFEDVTDRVASWAKLMRLEFNRKLEDWYNEGDGEEM